MKIRELLSDESKWTQQTCARDQNGERTEIGDPTATKFCIYGAIIKCYGECRDEIWLKLRKRIDGNPVAFNDMHTFEEVKAIVEELDV